MTTITITDPVLLKQIAEATGKIIFLDPCGNELLVADQFLFVPPPGFKSPISDEELERRRQNLNGRPLKDILDDLRKKYGN